MKIRQKSKVLNEKLGIKNKIEKNENKSTQSVKGVKMLSAMSSEQVKDISEDFLTTGRTGRRNALPDILSEHAHTSVADLPDKLASLSTSSPDEPCCSKDSTSSVPVTTTTAPSNNDSKSSQSNCGPSKS